MPPDGPPGDGQDNPPGPSSGLSARGLSDHVRHLAEEVGERHVFRPLALERAARYLEEQWAAMGFEVRSQVYAVEGQACRNLEVEVRGRNDREIVVVGAHYDSIIGSPGADDNATGIAVLLEVSRVLRAASFDRTLRFVAFVNEEPPWFFTPLMGSRVYADRCAARSEPVKAMVCLESLGYYREEPGSQKYPALLGLFYPDRGNFLAVVGDLRSRHVLREVVGALEGEGVNVQSLVIPRQISGVDWSDHASFWRHGYPAVMLTDTAPFRNPHYHARTDLPEHVDLFMLERVGNGVLAAVSHLARPVTRT